MAILQTVRVSEKGQIAIPQNIRKSAGITKGNDLIIIHDNGRILLEKVDEISEKIKDDFKDIFRFNEISLKEVWDNEEDDIWQSYLKK